MISKSMVHKPAKARAISPGLAAFRIFKSISSPIFYFIMGVAILLSFFNPKPGTNARQNMWIIAGICLTVNLVMQIIHRKLQKSFLEYKLYTPRFEEEFNPSTVLLIVVYSIIIVVPFYMIVITSFKTPTEANALDFTWTIQQGATLDNYQELFAYGDLSGIYMSRAFFNSLMLAIFPALISVLVSSAAAFLYAHGTFSGRRKQFRMLILTMLMPGCVTMGTGYLMMDVLGWTGTVLPLIKGCFFGAAGTVMFLREFMMGLPTGLFEAAEIDGAGKGRQFFTIALPLAKGAITGQYILGFLGGFNDFMGPLIYLHDPAMYTIQIALQFMAGGDLANGIIASGCIFVTIPTLLLYIVFQKQILSGISMSSGLKG